MIAEGAEVAVSVFSMTVESDLVRVMIAKGARVALVHEVTVNSSKIFLLNCE